MKKTKLILELYNAYNIQNRDIIIGNVEKALVLAKGKGIDVTKRKALPACTGRTWHAVASWFREGKQIPLIDLCKLSEYLQYNVFAFLEIGDFYQSNDYHNYHHPNAARIFLDAYNLQRITPKDIIVDNVERYYGTSEEMLSKHSNERQTRVMGICGCSKQTYYAWFNRSRVNVKIPMIELCKLADNAGVEVFEFFKALDQ